MGINRVDQNARPELKRFKLVQKTKKITRGEANRDPAGIKVSPSGIGEANTAGTEMFNSVAKGEGLDVNTYCIVFGGDEAQGQAAAVLVEPNTAGATPVRRDPAKKRITVYMADMFEETPELRPASARWCTMEKAPDGAGGNYVLIHMNQGLPRRSVKRSMGKGPEPAAQ